MDAQPAPRSGIPRRGPPAPIRTDLSQQHFQHQQQQQQQLPQPQKPKQLPVLQKQRPHRLRQAEPSSQPAEKVSLPPDPANRKPSKSSLKSLFSRNKALRDVKKNDPPLPQIGERRESDAQSTQPPETPRSFTGTVASVSTVVASTDLTPIATPTEPTFDNGPSRETKKESKAKPSRKSASPWVPPPLFQAYPQALKHTTAFAPVLSAEAILRVQASKASPAAKGESPSAIPGSAAARKKDEKDKKHARRMSVTSGDTLLAKKIFVLVTSGRLLQYAAEGRHDRLPEKLMRLGPTSAAFVSDAIPGKPYVIQVSQQFSDGKALPETTGRGFLSRFGIQGSDARRTVRTFLMVLSDPDEMSSWLVSLKMAIESVGGKHFEPESPTEEKNAEKKPRARSTTASRPLNLRKPSLNGFSQPPSGSFRPLSRSSISPAMSRKNSYQDSTPSSNLAKALSRRSITAPSDAISIATTTTMEPDTIYEDPRDAPLPPTRTPNISQPPSLRPSPATSPVQSPPPTPGLRKPSLPNTSMRTAMYATDHQKEDAAPSRRSSFISTSHSPPRSPSPPPPNFSVPSFSTRFTIPRRGSGPSVTSDTEDPPADPSTTESTEPRRKYSGLNIDMGKTAASNTVKHSLTTESTSNTTTPISPTKSSLPGPRGIPLSTTTSQPSSRYTQKVQSPETLQKALPSEPKTALPTPQRQRPLPRLPKQSEPDTPTALPSFAQSTPGTDRIKRTSLATAMPSRPPSQIAPPSQQTPRTGIPGAGGQRVSRMAVPASRSPSVGNTEQDKQPTRRLSALPQQTTGRKKSIPSLSSMAPPAPPPNCPLPEVPSDISAQRIPTWRKHSLLPAPQLDARRLQSPELRQMGFGRRQQISPPTITSSIPRHDPHGP